MQKCLSDINRKNIGQSFRSFFVDSETTKPSAQQKHVLHRNIFPLWCCGGLLFFICGVGDQSEVQRWWGKGPHSFIMWVWNISSGHQ